MNGDAAQSATSSDRPRVSVVVPVLDEAGTVPELAAELATRLEECEVDGELIIVDDGSRDGTWQQVLSLHERHAWVRGVRLSRNFGKDAAIVAGLEAARGDAVVVMDGDLQHPPELLPTMIERWRAGADVVEAVKRNRAGEPWTIRAGAKLFNRVFSRLTAVDLTGATDYRLLARPAVDALLALPERTVFFRGTSTWIGFERVQVDFEVEERHAGHSRFTFRRLARFAIRSLTAFTSAPLHLVTLIGVGFGVFSVALGIQTLVRWFQGHAVEGFTTVILLLLIQGSAVLIGLGIMGEYLARIHDEVKGRPRFIVAARTPDHDARS